MDMTSAVTASDHHTDQTFVSRSLRSLTSSWALLWKTRCWRSCLFRSRPGPVSVLGSRWGLVLRDCLPPALSAQWYLSSLLHGSLDIPSCFQAFVAIGDYNGHVGLGVKCSKEVATAIRGAIILAKLSIIPVRRGYWGNKIGKPHTVPCKVTGRCGSVLVRLIPAPRGTGIVSAPVPKKLLMMAGIDDCYTSARGCTATLGNFGKISIMVSLKAWWNNTCYLKRMCGFSSLCLDIGHMVFSVYICISPRSAQLHLILWCSCRYQERKYWV